MLLSADTCRSFYNYSYNITAIFFSINTHFKQLSQFTYIDKILDINKQCKIRIPYCFYQIYALVVKLFLYFK